MRWLIRSACLTFANQTTENDMIVNVSLLADALIGRLHPLLPDGCRLERATPEGLRGTWLALHTAEGSWGRRRPRRHPGPRRPRDSGVSATG